MKKRKKLKADFLAIDPLNLDKEWVGQSELYYKYAERRARASRQLDSAHSTLDVVNAELDNKIRSRPKRYGFTGKPTEGAIKSKISLMPEFQAASAAVDDAKFAVDINQAAVSALEHRRSALNKLTDLHLQAYYGEGEDMHSRAARRTKKI